VPDPARIEGVRCVPSCVAAFDHHGWRRRLHAPVSL